MQIAKFFLTLAINVSERKDNIYPWGRGERIDSYLQLDPKNKTEFLEVNYLIAKIKNSIS